MEAGAPSPGIREIDRHNNFDLLRFFLATAVVFAHSFVVLGGKHTRIGLAAVLGFFAISGYLVTQSWLRSRGVLGYFRKRVLRIYPGFAAACLFDHFVVAPVAGTPGARGFGPVAATTLLSQIVLLRHTSIRGVFGDLPVKSVNASLWTVPYEFLCYILLAVLGVLGFTRHRSWFLAFCVLVWTLHVVAPALPAATLAPWPGARRAEMALRFASCFLTGAVFFLYRDRVALTPTLAALAVALLVLSTSRAWTSRLVWPLGLPYVLFYLAYHPGIPLQGWGRAGDFSYGIYIYAFPIQQLLVSFAGSRLNPFSLFLAAMTITLPLAVGSWYFIEKPFLRLK